MPEGRREEVEELLRPLEEKVEKLSTLEQKMAEAMLALDERIDHLEKSTKAPETLAAPKKAKPVKPVAKPRKVKISAMR
jgi:cell division septum initiation protein DivIVA